MKICVVQTRSVKGDIQKNIANHKKLIELAISNGAGTIIFPELSLTGYEPKLAQALATHKDDKRFDVFQQLSDAYQITIGAGIPTKNDNGISITMVLFQPHQERQTYSKKYLHSDEDPYFTSGQNPVKLIGEKANMGLAICYELSVPHHSEEVFKNGAEIYIASVAKTAAGVDKANKNLSEIASRYSMTVLMSNCVGPSDDFVGAGNSAIWNNRGELMGQLNDRDEGILIVDTDTGEIIKKII